MRLKRSAKGGFVTPKNRNRPEKETERPHNRHPLLSLLPATKDVVEKIGLPAHLAIKKKKPTKKAPEDFPDLESKRQVVYLWRQKLHDNEPLHKLK